MAKRAREEYLMERKNAWKDYSEKELSELVKLNEGYIDFISECKTERLCAKRAIELAEKSRICFP